MSLREEMARYEHLTGESAEHIPIIKIGAFLDGVDRGIAELEKIKDEIMDTGAYEQEVHGKTEFLKGINYCLGVIDKHKAESEVENGSI